MNKNICKKFCFLTNIESKNNSFNELNLMLKSFRKNVVSLKNAVFWILVNDEGLSKDKVKYLKDNYGPIVIEQKKSRLRIPNVFTGPETYRKYNTYLYFNQYNDYDRIIHIDSDFIFLEDCKNLLFSDQADFAAHVSGNKCMPINILEYYKNVFSFTDKELMDISKMWKNEVKKKYINNDFLIPNFNSGFISLSKKGFLIIKANIEKFLYQVYSDAREVEGIGLMSGPREQIALTALILKKVKNYNISSIEFFGPKVFHLFKEKYGDAHYGGNVKLLNQKPLPTSVLQEIKKLNYKINY